MLISRWVTGLTLAGQGLSGTIPAGRGFEVGTEAPGCQATGLLVVIGECADHETGGQVDVGALFLGVADADVPGGGLIADWRADVS